MALQIKYVIVLRLPCRSLTVSTAGRYTPYIPSMFLPRASLMRPNARARSFRNPSPSAQENCAWRRMFIYPKADAYIPASDWLVGDNVLRSMYSIYDFGDFDSSGKMGNPYVKLLSLTDPNEASKEFHAVRGGVALTNITYNAADSTASGTVASGSSSESLTADTVDTLNSLGKYIPAMLAIMALNALAILLGLAAGAVYLVRRRRNNDGGARARSTPGRTDLAPMPMNPRPTSSFSMGSPGAQHTYEPVSMALTEDTVFVPPSPAFSKDGGKMRPMSVA